MNQKTKDEINASLNILGLGMSHFYETKHRSEIEICEFLKNTIQLVLDLYDKSGLCTPDEYNTCLDLPQIQDQSSVHELNNQLNILVEFLKQNTK